MKKIIILLFFILLIPQKAAAAPPDIVPTLYDQSRKSMAEDIFYLSNVMYYENYCNGPFIMLLTGSVVLNRVEHPGFPNTIKGVLYQKGQYSTVKKFGTQKIPGSVVLLALELLKEGSIAPPNVIFQSMFRQGSGIYYTERGEYFCYE